MNIYIKYDLKFDECTNRVHVYIHKTLNKPGVKLGSVELVGEAVVRVWPWDDKMSVENRLKIKMKKMLKKYFKNRIIGYQIKQSCERLSMEQYNLKDPSVVHMLKKSGIDI